MNRDKHIWEGWTVGDFIDDIEPIFDMANHINRQPFTNKAELKQWVKAVSYTHLRAPRDRTRSRMPSSA